MSNFTYTTGIPAANNNPSTDQPNMQTNNDNNALIWAVDHVSFNSANGGTHLQVTFSSKNAAGSQTDPQSVLYTGNGTASSVAQMFYRNQNATFLASPIHAFALCNSSGIVSSQSSNVQTVTRNSAGNYSISLSSNAVSSSNFLVLVSCGLSSGGASLTPGYTITGTGSFTLTFTQGTSALNAFDPTTFSFIVIQI